MIAGPFPLVLSIIATRMLCLVGLVVVWGKPVLLARLAVGLKTALSAIGKSRQFAAVMAERMMGKGSLAQNGGGTAQ